MSRKILPLLSKDNIFLGHVAIDLSTYQDRFIVLPGAGEIDLTKPISTNIKQSLIYVEILKEDFYKNIDFLERKVYLKLTEKCHLFELNKIKDFFPLSPRRL